MMPDITKHRRFLISVALFFLLTAVSCNHKGGDAGTADSSATDEERMDMDTLRAVTLYGPTSFFDYRGEPMGMDYENAKRFAAEEGLILDITPLDNIQQMIEALKTGKADLAAYPVPIIAEYKDEVIYCGHKEISTQVLVQKKSEKKLKDVTELVGNDIYVEKGSKYQYRLENLNEELGGGININILETDTIDTEDLLRMVAEGKIDYAVVDSSLASLFKPAFPNLDTELQLSSDQAGAWAVAKDMGKLASKIDNWENRTHSSDFVKEIYRQYYERTLDDNFDLRLSYFKERNLSKGEPVSAYDSYFKKHASTAGYDWKLLAAIAYCESRYKTDVASRFGAYGLMQIMPSTALSYGVTDLSSPDNNVLAAARFINKLDKSLANKVEDPEERLKFVVAAYNAGLGHIYDSIAIAEKVGLNPQKWTGNVGVAALMKSRPEYYNDPVVKNGYFRGRETVDFVDRVTAIYRYLNEKIPS